jgi:hypothetical protein
MGVYPRRTWLMRRGESTPTPPWIAILVLQKLKENDKKFKKIKNFEISISDVGLKVFHIGF